MPIDVYHFRGTTRRKEGMSHRSVRHSTQYHFTSICSMTRVSHHLITALSSELHPWDSDRLKRASSTNKRGGILTLLEAFPKQKKCFVKRVFASVYNVVNHSSDELPLLLHHSYESFRKSVGEDKGLLTLQDTPIIQCSQDREPLDRRELYHYLDTSQTAVD